MVIMKIFSNNIICAFLFISMPFYSSCGGQNLYSSFTTKDTKQKAEDAINSGDYNTSINLLAPYVAANSGDQQAIGMLTTSYMLLAGVNILNIMVSILNASGDSKNNFQAILSAMPTGNQTNVSLLTKALNTITLIPTSQMNSNQSYLYAITSASLAILTIKQDCLDSSGVISTSSTNAMNATDANSVYTNLTNAQTAFTSAGMSSSSNTGSGFLANLINQINSTAGASNSAKVINFIISQE
jgi:hypothetical protein